MFTGQLHVLAVKPDEQGDHRTGHRGGDDGHADQHPEQCRRQDLGVQADVQKHELHCTTGVHQDAEGQRPRPRIVEDSPRQVDPWNDLGRAGNTDQQGGEPEEVARELNAADPQTGVGEEEGHQEHPHELLHHPLRDVGQNILGYDGAHDEPAKDHVDPGQLGSCEAEEQDGTQHSELVAVVHIPLVQEAVEHRTNHEDHPDDVASRVEERPDGVLDTHRGSHGGHNREDHVHQHIVHAGDGHSGAADVRPQQAKLVHDATEHRKGRRGDAESHEEVEHQARHLGRPFRVQVIAEADSQHKGQDDHGDADGRNAVAGLELLPVEVFPHLKHIGTNPEEAEALDEEENVRLEDRLPLVHSDHLTEEDLGQDDAREHLHHHPGHADLFRDLTEQQGDHEDGGGDREEAHHRIREQIGKHGG